DLVGLVPHAMDHAGGHHEHVAGTEHLFSDLAHFRVAGARAVIYTLPEEVLLPAVHTDDDRPRAMIVRRYSASGQPTRSEHRKRMVRFLVEHMHTNTLIAVRLVMARLEPSARKRKPLHEWPQRQQELLLVVPSASDAPQIHHEPVE